MVTLILLTRMGASSVDSRLLKLTINAYDAGMFIYPNRLPSGVLICGKRLVLLIRHSILQWITTCGYGLHALRQLNMYHASGRISGFTPWAKRLRPMNVAGQRC